MQNITIVTRRGVEKWSAIDSLSCGGVTYYLLESNEYGDGLPYIVIDQNGKVQEWDCYDNLKDWLDS